jgi:hypothetical protein
MKRKISIEDQSGVRDRLIAYQGDSGATWIFIANKIKVPQPIMSQFKNAKINLFDDKYFALDSYLSEKGW